MRIDDEATNKLLLPPLRRTTAVTVCTPCCSACSRSASEHIRPLAGPGRDHAQPTGNGAGAAGAAGAAGGAGGACLMQGA
jgi:hypothetical protein